MVTVKNYLKYFYKKNYPALFDEECVRQLKNVELTFGEIVSEETILEVCLTKPEKTCDYSIRVDVDSVFLSEYWYELDYEAYALEHDKIEPCFFVDAHNVVVGEDNTSFYSKKCGLI